MRKTSQQIEFDNFQNLVVKICNQTNERADGHGSGVIVIPNHLLDIAYIFTAKHCLPNELIQEKGMAYRFAIEYKNSISTEVGRISPTNVIIPNPDVDLAIIVVPLRELLRITKIFPLLSVGKTFQSRGEYHFWGYPNIGENNEVWYQPVNYDGISGEKFRVRSPLPLENLDKFNNTANTYGLSGSGVFCRKENTERFHLVGIVSDMVPAVAGAYKVISLDGINRDLEKNNLPCIENYASNEVFDGTYIYALTRLYEQTDKIAFHNQIKETFFPKDNTSDSTFIHQLEVYEFCRSKKEALPIKFIRKLQDCACKTPEALDQMLHFYHGNEQFLFSDSHLCRIIAQQTHLSTEHQKLILFFSKTLRDSIRLSGVVELLERLIQVGHEEEVGNLLNGSRRMIAKRLRAELHLKKGNYRAALDRNRAYLGSLEDTSLQQNDIGQVSQKQSKINPRLAFGYIQFAKIVGLGKIREEYQNAIKKLEVVLKTPKGSLRHGNYFRPAIKQYITLRLLLAEPEHTRKEIDKIRREFEVGLEVFKEVRSILGLPYNKIIDGAFRRRKG